MSEEVKMETTQIVEKSSAKSEPKSEEKEKTVNGDHNKSSENVDELENSGKNQTESSEGETEQKKELESTEEKSPKPELDDASQEKTKMSPEKNKSPEKGQSENPIEEKGNSRGDDDEDDEDESDEELPPGLLERPVEILQAKRERKKTSRFTYDDVPTPSSDKKKVEIPNGHGVRLGDQPRVEWQLGRNKAEDLKIIHKLFFGVFGDTFSCKKNMRNFNGFDFDKDSNEYEKKEDYIGRFTLDNLKWALTVCDIENKKGKKEDLIDRFLEWCLCPKPSGKVVPEKKGKKDKSKKKTKKRKSKSSSKNSNASISSEDISDDDSDDDTEEDTSPKKTKLDKKPPQKKTPTPKSTPKSPQKRKPTGSPKKIAKVKIGSPKKAESVDSDDDSPLQKKAKKPPTNAQIRKEVAAILKGADLEVVTMKAVCLKVYERYPDFDLSDRKAFIKDTVKSIIS